MSPTPRTRMMEASAGRCTLQSYSEMGCGWSGAGRPAEAASRPGVGYSDLRQLPRLDEVYEDVRGERARTSSAQAPERSGETWGKCPEKARSRSGHALVASWSGTGSFDDHA